MCGDRDGHVGYDRVRNREQKCRSPRLERLDPEHVSCHTLSEERMRGWFGTSPENCQTPNGVGLDEGGSECKPHSPRSDDRDR